jgi:hypothetical protein
VFGDIQIDRMGVVVERGGATTAFRRTIAAMESRY